MYVNISNLILVQRHLVAPYLNRVKMLKICMENYKEIMIK